MNEAKRMDRQALPVAQTPAFVRRYAQFLLAVKSPHFPPLSASKVLTRLSVV